MRSIARCLLATLALAAARPASAVAPSLALHRAADALPVYDRGTDRIRWLEVRVDPPAGVTLPAGVVALERTATGLRCDCGALLGPSEVVVSDVPVFDPGLGRSVSVDDMAFRALVELRDYPLDTLDLRAVALSELAYLDNSNVLREVLAERGFVVPVSVGYREGEEPPGGEVPFFLADSEARGEAYLVVRGTASLDDASRNLEAQLVLVPEAGGRAHAGYLDTLRAVAPAARPTLADLGARGRRLVATGHSLGGAVATLLVLTEHDELPSLRAVTFASPPPVDAALAAASAHLPATHHLVPGEELAALRWSDRAWPGAVHWLPEVAEPALGVRHFVLNYLEAVATDAGHDGAAWRRSLRSCVHWKTACFRGVPAEALLPRCVFWSAACLERYVPAGAVADGAPPGLLDLLRMDPAVRPLRMATASEALARRGASPEPLLSELERLGYGGPWVDRIRAIDRGRAP